MRYEKQEAIPNEKLYYLCDTRTIVGNCLMFWRKGGCGYTYNLDDCEVYTETEAFKMHQARETDYPIPKHIVDSLAERHLDHQDFDLYFDRWKIKQEQQKVIDKIPTKYKLQTKWR